MPLITHPEHGADNVPDHEVKDREEQGWKVTTLRDWQGNKYRGGSNETQPQARGKYGKRS